MRWGGGELRGLSQWVKLYTGAQIRSNSIFNLWKYGSATICEITTYTFHTKMMCKLINYYFLTRHILMMLAIFDTVFVTCVGAAYSLPLLSHHWKVTTGNKNSDGWMPLLFATVASEGCVFKSRRGHQCSIRGFIIQTPQELVINCTIYQENFADFNHRITVY